MTHGHIDSVELNAPDEMQAVLWCNRSVDEETILQRYKPVCNSEETTMKLVATLTATALLAFVGTSAMAQTAAPATTAPAATTTAPAAPTTTMKPAAGAMAKKATAPAATTPAKTAISKACSAQADAKGLHGKERHKFRSDCKKNGGKV